MGLQFPWLEITTKKERKRREEKARRQMFPFGEAQREAELRLLRELIEARARDNDLLFQLVRAKDCLHRREDEEEEEQTARLRGWLHSPLATLYPPQQLMRFLALAELEQGIQDLSELPDAAAVRQRAEELCRTWAEDLQ